MTLCTLTKDADEYADANGRRSARTAERREGLRVSEPAIIRAPAITASGMSKRTPRAEKSGRNGRGETNGDGNGFDLHVLLLLASGPKLSEVRV